MADDLAVEELLRTPVEDDRECEQLMEGPPDAQVVELTNRVKALGNNERLLSTEVRQQLEELDAHVLYALAKEKLHRDSERGATFVGHRSSTTHEAFKSDTNALSLFHICSGRSQESGDPDMYTCSVRGRRFGDVTLVDDPLISELPITSIYSLARYISIYETEADSDRKRLLMRSPSHVFLTAAGVEKAYAFFKQFCDHTQRALMRHDGSMLALATTQGLDIDVLQLNDLMNIGVRYAQVHSWDNVKIENAVKTTLIMMPSGFESYDRVVILEDYVRVHVYSSLFDLCSCLNTADNIGTIVLVAPVAAENIERNSWSKLAMTLTASARKGAKILAVSGPKGESTWESHRRQILETMEIAREAAAAMRSNVISLLGQVPSITEPFVAMGFQTRECSTFPFPPEAVKNFLLELQKCVEPHVRKALFTCRDKVLSRNQVYKMRKRAEQRSGSSYKHPRHDYPNHYPRIHQAGRPSFKHSTQRHKFEDTAHHGQRTRILSRGRGRRF